jgi:hypothetical protein
MSGARALEVTRTNDVAATVTTDTANSRGGSCAHLGIAIIDGTNWHVDFERQNRPLQQGASYDLIF